MKTFTRRAALGVALLTLSGCDWVGILAKEAAVSAASHRGWDTFTFKGQLPAEFGIDAIAFYGPNEPGKASCQTPSFEAGKTITRRYSKQYTAEIQAQPQTFSFEIPLSYYKGLCGMRLGRVKLEINGRHGPLDWQRTYGLGGFYVTRNRSEKTVMFNDLGTFDRTGVCSWWFQQSQARSRFGELEKILNCRASFGDFALKDLNNKTINLKIDIDPEEKPSMKNRWITTDSGWKPCQETETSNRCQSPPTFKTFKMNGHTCTVYPGCTE
ncbi:hypothetical protein [Pseudomonas viridiflava]|uniref:hypothetical protein n=1 Tax=Pseudomonas viridiflava TaxID=33069 RepID=UPI000F05A12C|nr:hypothetical protein [Pseudomonas viridiflava]